jgi:hypothetical protein
MTEKVETGECRVCGQQVEIWRAFLPYRVLIDHLPTNPMLQHRTCNGSQLPPAQTGAARHD